MKIALKPKFKYFMLPKYSGLIRFPYKAKINEFNITIDNIVYSK